MKKKDGSYIWVHDIGRCVTAENGHPAIASVCIDITAQKKAQDEVLHLYNNIPGAVFRCRPDAELFIICLLYTSRVGDIDRGKTGIADAVSDEKSIDDGVDA